MSKIEDVEFHRLVNAVREANRALDEFQTRRGYIDVMATVAALDVFIGAYPDPSVHMAEFMELITKHRNLSVTLSSSHSDKADVKICIMRYFGSERGYVGSSFAEAVRNAICGERTAWEAASAV
jgi:hypothetical protein